jgi:hypothetical protein
MFYFEDCSNGVTNSNTFLRSAAKKKLILGACIEINLRRLSTVREQSELVDRPLPDLSSEEENGCCFRSVVFFFESETKYEVKKRRNDTLIT